MPNSGHICHTPDATFDICQTPDKILIFATLWMTWQLLPNPGCSHSTGSRGRGRPCEKSAWKWTGIVFKYKIYCFRSKQKKWVQRARPALWYMCSSSVQPVCLVFVRVLSIIYAYLYLSLQLHGYVAVVGVLLFCASLFVGVALVNHPAILKLPEIYSLYIVQPLAR